MSLLAELERIVSLDSLKTNPDLSQYLDAQLYLPIDVIATLPELALLLPPTLASAIDAIRTAVHGSSKLAIDRDGLNIRPIVKISRKTVCVRGLPPDASPADFSFPGKLEASPQPGGLWYLNFQSEEDAIDACGKLNHSEVKGRRLSCSMKSEPIVRSFFSPPPAPRTPLRYTIDEMLNLRGTAHVHFSEPALGLAKYLGIVNG